MRSNSILAICAMALMFVSCEKNPTGPTGQDGKIQCSTDNYLNYVRVVSGVLANDALCVYALWEGTDNMSADDKVAAENAEFPELTAAGYGARFRNPNANDQSYPNQQACLFAMIDGCTDIATEVADAKIGEPYNNGDVYGVESWYSFNSFTDYDDNIISIENVFMGGPEETRQPANSLYAYLTAKGGEAQTAAEAVKTAIAYSHETLDAAAATGCFRDLVLNKKNGKSSAEVEDAMEAIGQLAEKLDNLKQYIPADETNAQNIIDNFVTVTVIPTYKSLKEEAALLSQKVANYSEEPTQDNLNAACEQWKKTRIPWEESEAFLFGPVANQQIDPHLDSWPLSQINIKAILTSNLDWANEDGSSMGANTLGFHTLEYLLFSNGEPRSISDFISGDTVTLE